jgi:hypothetical protein
MELSIKILKFTESTNYGGLRIYFAPTVAARL